MDADLEADLEAAMQEESLGAPTPLTTEATPSMLNGPETPAVEDAEEEEEEEDSEDESLEDDDDEDIGTVEVDEDEKARLAQLQGVKEDITDLEKEIESAHQRIAMQTNPILRNRLQEILR
jgi:transcription initiation factor TFIID subunit 7